MKFKNVKLKNFQFAKFLKNCNWKKIVMWQAYEVILIECTFVTM